MEKETAKTRLQHLKECIDRSFDDLQSEVRYWSDQIRRKSGWCARNGVRPARLRLNGQSADPGAEHEILEVTPDGKAVIQVGDRRCTICPKHYEITAWSNTKPAGSGPKGPEERGSDDSCKPTTPSDVSG